MAVNLQTMKQAESRVKASLSSALNSTALTYLILLIILIAAFVFMPGK